ncbi:D-alanyl-D-alanine carboxypeptidase family protein [Macrococcoides goetzii]|nr:M15 family metallopeptidase [Macrococcus goetzii]TDM44167.1 D-alanyl-D-alanine carboxypeptidase family protein [Macrococcus goetzii]
MKKILLASVLLLTSCSLPEYIVKPEKSEEKAADTKDTQQKNKAVQQKKETLQKKKVPKYNKEVKNGVTYINGILIVNKKISLPPTYNPGENKSVRKILNKMIVDAQKDNMHLVVRSAYRSYAAQKALYDKFVALDGQQIAESYSAKPGQSEHQTGLAYDIGSRESVANMSIQFGQTPEGNWLKENAHKYGFIIRYGKDKTHITGYRYEPWHIRYVGKVHAAKLYRSGQTLEEYLGVYKKPVAKKISRKVATTEQPTTEVTTSEILTIEQPISEQLTIEQSITERPLTEQPTIEINTSQ